MLLNALLSQFVVHF